MIFKINKDNFILAKNLNLSKSEHDNFLRVCATLFLAKPSQKVKNKTKLSFFIYVFDCFY